MNGFTKEKNNGTDNGLKAIYAILVILSINMVMYPILFALDSGGFFSSYELIAYIAVYLFPLGFSLVVVYLIFKTDELNI